MKAKKPPFTKTTGKNEGKEPKPKSTGKKKGK
jgi:hypothetical protein